MTQPWVLTEDEAVELLAFLVSAARTQLDDPCAYGSMRLLTAAEMLRDRIRDRASTPLAETLAATDEATAAAQTVINDTETYTRLLDELCGTVARHLVQAGDTGTASA